MTKATSVTLFQVIQRSLYIFAAGALFSLHAHSSTQESPTAQTAFTKMKDTLTGEWQQEGDKESNLIIQFNTTANASVLVETWLYKGKPHSLTLYHMDHEKVIATHYCPQGNQPRMASTQLTPDSIEFDFIDATNLSSPDSSHQHSLGFTYIDNKLVEREETYLKDKEESPSMLRLVKIK